MHNRIAGFFLGIVLALSVNAKPVGILKQVKDTVDCNRWVEMQLSKMTLKQKIGQLFIHTVAPVTTQWNRDGLTKAVEEYGVGGLLFSGGQLEKQVQLTNEAQKKARIPLLITFDGEWGLAMRLKNTPKFPKNRVLGCIKNDTLIYRYGLEVARQLKEIGVHVNFAPVADVDNNPDNPVINVRSFGADPQVVARKVLAYSRGLEDGGVLAVCKHFPGHGDTDVDSHKALPVLQFDRERLDSIELYPFRKAIDFGIGGIMVGHLKVPELGQKPASISPKVIINTLKRELGFSGLVFTDALEMDGIAKNSVNVCAEALIAGNDLLLAPRNLKRELDGVMKAIKDGRLTEEEITEKCRKVLTYKYALGLVNPTFVKAEGLSSRLDTKQTRILMSELENAAVTVVKNKSDVLPLDLAMSGTVLLTIAPTLSEGYPFLKELRKSVTLSWIHAEADSLQQIKERLRPAQQVIVALHEKDCKPYESLIEDLAMDKPLTLVCFKPQSILEKIPSAVRKSSAVVLAHTGKKDVQRYTANILTGKKIANATLSVDIPGIAAVGEGVVLDPDSPRLYKPEDFGMDSKVLAEIDDIAEEGIREQAFPGCHVLIYKDGYPVYNKCFGTQTYKSDVKVKENDMYDLASVSKVTGTLLAVMKLYDEGRFGLTDKIGKYVPALQGTDKANLTIQSLLFHESGLPPYVPFYLEAIDLDALGDDLFKRKPDANHTLQVDQNLYADPNFKYKAKWVSSDSSSLCSLRLSDKWFLNRDFKDEILRQIIETPLKSRSYRYSCLNFMLLKEMVETITRTPMDEYLDRVFYQPMGLIHTTYNPLSRFRKECIIPTVDDDFLRRGELRGYVHDAAAAFMGGVSGNAGLFSTAHDVAVIFQMLLNRGVYGDRRYLNRATCELFLTMKSKSCRRGLGFDKPDMDDEEKSPCAPDTPGSVIGHTGFTGTAVWADPDNDLIFVFLSNRTFPQPFSHKNLSRLDIRPRMQQVMYQALMK